METFGKKLIELREHRKLKQEKLATDLQLSQPTISNYELGLTKPNIEILEKICKYFNVPMSYLFSDEKLFENIIGDGNKNIANIINNNIHTEELIESQKLLIEEKDIRIKEKNELILFLKEENQKLKDKISTLKTRLSKYETN